MNGEACPTPPTPTPTRSLAPARPLTASALKSFRACARLYRHQHVDLVRPVAVPEALRFGTLFHAGLAAWWSESDFGIRLDRALYAMVTPGGPSGETPPDPFDLARAEVLMRGYDARWGSSGSGCDYESLAVEVEFRAPLINPMTGAASRTWELAGKIDAIVRESSTGRVLIVEHKTASGSDVGPGSEYWKRLRMDGQVSQYYLGARALGHDVAGCLYDVVSKPAQRPTKATPPDARKYTKAGTLYANQHAEDEIPDEYRARLVEAVAADPNRYYVRGEIVRLEDELAEGVYDVWSIGRQIRDCELADRWPKNPDSCVRYGRTCEFFPVCSREASLDDATLYRKIETTTPELSGALVGV